MDINEIIEREHKAFMTGDTANMNLPSQSEYNKWKLRKEYDALDDDDELSSKLSARRYHLTLERQMALNSGDKERAQRAEDELSVVNERSFGKTPDRVRLENEYLGSDINKVTADRNSARQQWYEAQKNNDGSRFSLWAKSNYLDALANTYRRREYETANTTALEKTQNQLIKEIDAMNGKENEDPQATLDKMHSLDAIKEILSGRYAAEWSDYDKKYKGLNYSDLSNMRAGVRGQFEAASKIGDEESTGKYRREMQYLDEKIANTTEGRRDTLNMLKIQNASYEALIAREESKLEKLKNYGQKLMKSPGIDSETLRDELQKNNEKYESIAPGIKATVEKYKKLIAANNVTALNLQTVNAPDFEKHNKYVSANVEIKANSKMSPEKQNKIINDENFRLEVGESGMKASGATIHDETLRTASMAWHMKESEKGVYNYLHNTKGEKAANEYFEELSENSLSDRVRGENKRQSVKFAENHEIGASVASVAYNVLNGILLGEKILNIDTPDPLSNVYGDRADTIRETVQKDMSATGKVAYNVVTSAADTAAAMGLAALTGGAAGGALGLSASGVQKTVQVLTQVIMSSEAASSTLTDAKDRGLSNEQALALSLTSGLIEAATEKYSIEALLKPSKNFGSYLFKNFLTEGSEEAASEVLNNLADVAIAGDQSQWKTTYNAALKNGADEKTATKAALVEHVKNIGMSALVGALSGGLMGAVGYVPQARARANFKKAVTEAFGSTDSAADALNEAAAYTGTKLDIKANPSAFDLQMAVAKLSDGIYSDFYKLSDMKAVKDKLADYDKVLTESGTDVLLLKSVQRSAQAAGERLNAPMDVEEVYNAMPNMKAAAEGVINEAKEKGFVDKNLAEIDAEDRAEARNNAGNVPTVQAAENASENIRAESATSAGETARNSDARATVQESYRAADFSHLAVDDSQLNESEQSLQSTAKKRGVTVKYFEPNAASADVNGWRAKDGTIFINRKADAPKQILIHELTHYGEANRKGYEAFKSTVKKSKVFENWLSSKGVGATTKERIATLIDQYISGATEFNRQHGGTYLDATAQTAESEIFANFAEEVLFNEKTPDALLKDDSLTVEEKHGIAKFVLNAIERLKDFFHKSERELKKIKSAWQEMLSGVENDSYIKTTEDGAVKYSTAKPFAEQVDDVLNGTHKKNLDLYVDETPEYLQKLNFSDGPIIMRNSKILEILDKHIEMSVEIIKQIPELLKDPILVLKSKTQPEVSVVVITDCAIGNKNVILPIWINQEAAYADADLNVNFLKTNAIASAYGRTLGTLIDYANNNEGFLYQTADKKRVEQLLRRNRLQLPTPLKLSNSNIIIPQSENDVNSNHMQNEEKNSESLQKDLADPQESTADPQESTADPQEGSAEPQESTADLQESSADPQEGSADPQEGSAEPQESSAAAKDEGNSPTPDEDFIQKSSVKLEKYIRDAKNRDVDLDVMVDDTDEALKKAIKENPEIYKEVKTAAARKTVRALLKEYNSKADVVDVTRYMSDLRKLCDKADTMSPEAFTKEAHEFAEQIAEVITDGIATETTVSADAQRVLDVLKQGKFYLNDAQRAEIVNKYGSFKDWVTKYRQKLGYVTDAADGTTLEAKYRELNSFDSQAFPENVAAADMAVKLTEAYEQFSQQFEDRAFSNEERSYVKEQVTADVLDTAAALETVQSEKGKYAERLLKAAETERARYNERISKMDAKYKQKLQLQKLDSDYRQTQIKKQYEAALEKQEKAVSQNKELRAGIIESQEQRKYRDGIMRSADHLITKLNENTKTKHVPESFKEPLAQLLTALDPSSKTKLRGRSETKSDVKFSAALSKMAEVINDHVALKKNYLFTDPLSLPDSIVSDFMKLQQTAAEIESGLTSAESGAESGKYVLNKMNSQQLGRLYHSIRTVELCVNKANELTENSRFKDVGKAGGKLIDYVKKLGSMKDQKFSSARQSLRWDMVTPYYGFKRLGTVGQAMFEELTDGMGKFTKNSKTVIDFVSSIVSKKETKAWGKQIEEITASGKTLKLPITHIMSLYGAYGRPHNKTHIDVGGIQPEAFRQRGREINQGVFHLTEEELNDAFSRLNERQKEVVDKIAEFYRTTARDWGNAISMARWGFNQLQDPKYWPATLIKDGVPMVSDIYSGNDMYGLMNFSALKKTAPNADVAFSVGNIFDTFSKYTSQMALYNAMTLPILDIAKVMNYNFTVRDGSQTDIYSVRKAVSDAYGNEGINYFVKLLEDISNSVQRADGETFVEKLSMKIFKNMKAARVASNLRVVVQQPTAYFRAGAVLSEKSLAKALIMKPQIEKSRELCPIVQWKELGFFSMNTAQPIAEQIKNSKGFTDRVLDRSLYLAGAADSVTLGFLWNACEIEIQNEKPDLKFGSKEFNDAVSQKLTEVVYRTQVVDSVLTRSQGMRNAGFLAKFNSAYMAEPVLSFNVLMDCYDQYSALRRAGASKKEAWAQCGRQIRKSITALAVNALFNAIVNSVSDAWRDKDRESFLDSFINHLIGDFSTDKTPLENLKEFLNSNIVRNINPLSQIPGVNQLYDALVTDYGSESVYSWWEDDIRGIGVLLKTISNSLTGKENPSNRTLYGTIGIAADAISNTTGLPIKNLMREAVDIWNNTAGAADETLIIRSYERSNKEICSSMYEAAVNGNRDKYERLWNDMLKAGKTESSIRSGLIAQLRENDDRIPEAHELFKERSSADAESRSAAEAEYNDLVEEITADGFSVDMVVDAIKGYKTAEEAEQEAKQKKQVEKAAAVPAKEYSENVYARAAYKLLNPDEKASVLRKINAYAKDEQENSENIFDMTVRNLKVKLATEAGITPGEYFATLESADGGRNAKVRAINQNNDLTKKQKEVMITIEKRMKADNAELIEKWVKEQLNK